MAGEAQTAAFLLSAGTVMLGPVGALYDLTPTQHTLGLVKNIQMSQTPTYVDLTQGPKGTIVYSTLTANPMKVNFEVFEYTSANMAYGLGLEGYNLPNTAAVGNQPLDAALTGNTGSPVTVAHFSNAADISLKFPQGQWISIQANDGNGDHVHYAKLTTACTVSGSGPFVHTLTFTAHGLKTGNNFAAGDFVTAVDALNIGSKLEQPYHSAKITGLLPEGNKPFTVLIPKIKIIKGFSLSFTTDNYGNMPFEFQPFELVPTDPFYADFVGQGVAKLFINT